MVLKLQPIYSVAKFLVTTDFTYVYQEMSTFFIFLGQTRNFRKTVAVRQVTRF